MVRKASDTYQKFQFLPVLLPSAHLLPSFDRRPKIINLRRASIWLGYGRPWILIKHIQHNIQGGNLANLRDIGIATARVFVNEIWASSTTMALHDVHFFRCETMLNAIRWRAGEIRAVGCEWSSPSSDKTHKIQALPGHQGNAPRHHAPEASAGKLHQHNEYHGPSCISVPSHDHLSLA